VKVAALTSAVHRPIFVAVRDKAFDVKLSGTSLAAAFEIVVYGRKSGLWA
jgi:hypothetical protein